MSVARKRSAHRSLRAALSYALVLSTALVGDTLPLSMDVIEAGTAAPPSRRRRLAFAVAAAVVLVALYRVRLATDSPAPQPQPSVVLSLVTPIEIHGIAALVDPELGQQALHTLPKAIATGGVDLVGASYTNGRPYLHIQDDSMSRQGWYTVTMLCVGQGGIETWLIDAGRTSTQRGVHTRNDCGGRPYEASVELTTPSLEIDIQPDPATIAAFAYAINPTEPRLR